MLKFSFHCLVMCFCVVVLWDPSLAFARPDALVVDLAENHIDITTGFDGAHLILFGVREDKEGAVAVVVRGPERTMVVRKKEQVFGAWVNRRSMQFRKVPSYYDYAVSDQGAELLPSEMLKSKGIGLDSLYFEPDYSKKDKDYIRSFQEALIRNKQLQGIYPVQPKVMKFLGDRLFRAEFYIPANVPPGEYSIHTYLIKNQEILDENVTQLRVAQVGFSAMLYGLAYGYGFAYGLICVCIALGAGFGINLLKR